MPTPSDVPIMAAYSLGGEKSDGEDVPIHCGMKNSVIWDSKLKLSIHTSLYPLEEKVQKGEVGVP